MRLIVADCQVDYVGKLTAHLAPAKRLIIIKSDGSVSIHADDKAYKPLNWMTAPCWLSQSEEDGQIIWSITNKQQDKLVVRIFEIISDNDFELGIDPGLHKDGVETHLQELLAENMEEFGKGFSLIRREYMTAIGPVDILGRDAAGKVVAIEIKRRGGINGVEQLTRYLELLNRDDLLAPVKGIFAAQQITPQAKTLAKDRGIECFIVDYDKLRGIEKDEYSLF